MNKITILLGIIIPVTLFSEVYASSAKETEIINTSVKQASTKEHPFDTQLKQAILSTQKQPTHMKNRFQKFFTQLVLNVKLYMNRTNIVRHAHPIEKFDLPSADKTTPINIAQAIEILSIRKECEKILTNQHPFLLYNNETLAQCFQYLLEHFKDADIFVYKTALTVQACLSTQYVNSINNWLASFTEITILAPKYEIFAKCLGEIHKVLRREINPGYHFDYKDESEIPLIEFKNDNYQFKDWVKEAYKEIYKDLSEENKITILCYEKNIQDDSIFDLNYTFTQLKTLYIPTNLDEPYTINMPQKKEAATHTTNPLAHRKKKNGKRSPSSQNKRSPTASPQSSFDKRTPTPETCSSIDTDYARNETPDLILSSKSQSPLLPQPIREVWHPRIQEWQYYEDKTNPLTCKALKKQGYLGDTNHFKANLMREYTEKYHSETEAAKTIINNHLFPRSISIYIFNTMKPVQQADGSYSFSVPAFRFNKLTNCYDYGFIEIGYFIEPDKPQTYNVFHRFFRIVPTQTFMKDCNIENYAKKQEQKDHEYALALSCSEKTTSVSLETDDNSSFQMVGETDSAWKIDETSSTAWTHITHDNPSSLKDMDAFSYGILKSSHLMK